MAGVRKRDILHQGKAGSGDVPANPELHIHADDVPDAYPWVHLPRLLSYVHLPLRVHQVAQVHEQPGAKV